MTLPFLLAAATKPGKLSGEDLDAKPVAVAVVGIALPQLAIPQGEGDAEGSEGIAKSTVMSSVKGSTIGEEEDEEEMKRQEMIRSITAGAAILGMSLVSAWKNLNEPRIHSVQLALSSVVDAAVENNHVAARGATRLAKLASEHLHQELSYADAPVTVLMAVKDEHHEQLWFTAAHGPLDAEPPLTLQRHNNMEDLAWQACESMQTMHIPRVNNEDRVLGVPVVQDGEAERCILLVPLIVPPDDQDRDEGEIIEEESDRGFCVGLFVITRKAVAVPEDYDKELDPDIEQGFTRDELAIADVVQNPLASAVHAVTVRETVEHILQGLLRRYAGAHVGEAPLAAGSLPPSFSGPMVCQFRRQRGQEILKAHIHSSRLHPLHADHDGLEGLPIKPKNLSTEVQLAFGSQQRGAEVQA